MGVYVGVGVGVGVFVEVGVGVGVDVGVGVQVNNSMFVTERAGKVWLKDGPALMISESVG